MPDNKTQIHRLTRQQYAFTSLRFFVDALKHFNRPAEHVGTAAIAAAHFEHFSLA